MAWEVEEASEDCSLGSNYGGGGAGGGLQSSGGAFDDRISNSRNGGLLSRNSRDDGWRR